MLKIKQALISVYNKQGITELAKNLAELGVEIKEMCSGKEPSEAHFLIGDIMLYKLPMVGIS
jgi:hypothetical protein